MAERAEVEEQNQPNFVSLQIIGSNEDQQNSGERLILNSIEGLGVSNINSLMEVDNTADEVQESKDSEESDKPIASASNTNEEGHVESPSTIEDNFIYKCVFCERILTGCDDPKLLECLHNACGSCVSNKVYEQNDNNPNGKSNVPLECASCSLNSNPDKLIENQFLLELSSNEDNGAAKSAEIKCSSCSDDAIAVSFCVDCSEYICDSCVQAHQRLKITKDHTIKTKEEGYLENQTGATGSGSTTLHCTIHTHEKLSLFCENCDKLTCRDCQLIEHRDHKYKFTHEIASDTRKYISGMLKDVSYKRVLLNSAMKVIDDRQNLISDKKQALVKEITQLVVKLTNTINVRGKQLVSRLTEVCEQKQKTLQEKKFALDQLSKMTDHCISFTQHALDSGSDMALLYCKRQVTTHLQRIKCKRADIPNPEIPVRIHLALDKVPDLIKVISTIGQIVVDGRVYPAPATSPASSLPPHGSPSPVHLRPPQQQSPLNQQLQMQQQQHPPQQPSPSGFPQPRLPPPYSQYQSPPNMQLQQQNQMGPNIQQQQQNMQQNIVQKFSPNVRTNLIGGGVLGGPVGTQSASSIPMSLAQHLQQNLQRVPLQRTPLGRTILPMSQMTNHGLNHQQQQQVSSSTHPQGLMQERANLRGLLQPNSQNAVYIQTGPSQYQAVQPQFAQQYQTRYAASQQLQQFRQQAPIRSILSSNQQQYRMPLQRIVNVNQDMQPQQPLQVAKWHIPQNGTNSENLGNHLNNSNNSNVLNRGQVMPGINDNFKITLKSQTNVDSKPTAAVSSTIPKTPSPNHIQGKSDTERNLDKYCQDSVNDLMATIAKLDSNGVQVLAEGRPKTGGSPHVDSSTDDNAGPSGQVKTDSNEIGKDDPNEDWCAVCMDGGELVCCDKCPKVFHQLCHIPNLSIEESDTWQCLLCMNFADITDSSLGERKEGELSPKEKKIAERLILELYCQYEPSLPFREVIGLENAEYHSIIKKPIALDTIRHKLDWSSEGHYTNMEDLVKDVRLMFRNAYTYNEEGTQVFNDAKALEKFFDEQLEKLLPQYAYERYEDDDIQPPSKKFKRIISD